MRELTTSRERHNLLSGLMSMLLLLLVLVVVLPTARAATLNFDGLSIDFVEIGGSAAADNEGFKNPVGRVDDDYSISTYEIRESHIDAFNAANLLAGTPVPDITDNGRGLNKPATSISWYEAAHFINWLNETHGASPAYKYSGGVFALWSGGDVGYDASNEFRNSDAIYWLPTVDEWHKAAYGSPGGTWYNYPTGSDVLPIAVASGTAAGSAVYNSVAGVPADVNQAGGLSGYDVMGMGGNVFEWEETAFDLPPKPLAAAAASKTLSSRPATRKPT